MKVSQKERAVLAALVEAWKEEEGACVFFRGIVKRVPTLFGMDEAMVRKSCRSLARKGLAEHVMGLFDGDGFAAGSGYSATKAGVDLMEKA